MKFIMAAFIIVKDKTARYRKQTVQALNEHSAVVKNIGVYHYGAEF